MQPAETRAQQPFILKLLPLMIGYFSQNVPAALCIYWFANNIFTTVTTVMVKNSMGPLESATAAAAAPAEPTTWTPPVREKPSGFASSTFADSGVKPITPIDAEVIEDDFEDDDIDEVEAAESGAGMASADTPKPKKVSFVPVAIFLEPVFLIMYRRGARRRRRRGRTELDCR